MKTALDALKIQSIITAAEQLIVMIVGIPQNPKSEKRGGYLTIASRVHQLFFPLLVVPIGELVPEKIEKQLLFSQEKASRLFNNPLTYSSWETRNPEQDRWGGAINGTELLFSFSGLPEVCDEALTLMLAIKFDHLSVSAAQAIADTSKNEVFKPLWEATQ